MPSLRLDSVTKRYGRNAPAVEDLSLEVAEGELLVLVGPSGCGKTTTLRLIAGLERADAGTIRIGEKIVDRLPPHARDAAMVFQSYALYPHLTVFDNLAFGLRMREGGLLARTLKRALSFAGADGTERDIRERVVATAEKLSLTPLLARYPRQLSGGERQRVAVGRAIVREPAVFLFDEPLSNLDVRLRERTRRELRRLHQESGAAAIYVTHDQQEAMTLGDRIAVMNAGRLQQIATPREAYDRPVNVFVARFLGSPGMNLVEGRLAEADGQIRFRGGGFDVPFPSDLATRAPREGRIALGFRPHDARVVPPGEGHASSAVRSVEDLGDALHYLLDGGGVDSGAIGGADSAEVVISERKTSGTTPLHRACPCGILLNDSRLHWFATETGDSLRNA